MSSSMNQYEPPLVKELIFFPSLHEKMRNLAERSKKWCIEIEKKIGPASTKIQTI